VYLVVWENGQIEVGEGVLVTGGVGEGVNAGVGEGVPVTG